MLNWSTRNKGFIIDCVLICSAILTIWSYLRIIPIIIFTLNILTFKRHLSASIIFVIIAFSLSILSIIVNLRRETLQKTLLREGFHEEAASMSKRNLDSLSLAINVYKLKYGSLPVSLLDIQITTKMKNVVIKDLSYNLKDGEIDNPIYYYKIIDSNKFYLAGVGEDGKPMTSDDLLPSN